MRGKKFWLWAFRSKENDVLITIVDSEGRDVMKDTLGRRLQFPEYNGWKAYSYLKTIQRCCPHLIREGMYS